MSITRQLLLLFFVSFVSEIISGFLPFIFPSSLMSMLMVFMFLYFKFVKLEEIEPVGTFLQKNISIFFLPPAVSLIEEWDFIKDKIFVLLFISVVSFVVTFFVTGVTANIVINMQEKAKNK